jgi:hypothetical protein
MGLFDNINNVADVSGNVADPSGIASLGMANPVAPAPVSVNSLYDTVLGRAPDQGGLSYWNQQFGDTVDENELATFKAAAAPELSMTGYTAPAAPTAPYQDIVSQWAAANPNATPSQLTAAIQSAGGLTPEFANAVAKQYGTTSDYVNSAYQANQGINSLYQTYLGRAPESQAVVDQYISQYGPTIDPNEIAAFRAAAAAELKNTGFLSNPVKGEVQSYVNSVLGDKTLSFADQANKIIGRSREVGLTPAQLESMYGKEKVQPFMDAYKTNINQFINTTLAKDPGTTMNEVGLLHKAAVDNKWTVDELVKYGGLDKTTAQSYFDLYDKGLGSIVASLNDPKTDDTTKTATLLSLSQSYGTSDADIAKASKGKFTEKEVAAYLDPVRNVPTGLQKLMDDPSASAADITRFILKAKEDPRAAGIYGVGLNKVLAAGPELVMRDIQNGTGSLAESYQTFLNVAKSTPENATKYAPQIAQIEKMLGTATFTANENFGGKPQDYQLQIVSPLTAKAKENIPQQLEMTPIKTETRDDGEGGTYQVQTGGGVKSKGVQEITTGGEDNALLGYRSTKPTTVNGLPVYANYDAAGKLTGYEADPSYRSWLNGKQSISGSWDANGSPKPAGHQSSGAGIRGFTQDIMSDSVMGPLATMAASYFGGPLGIAALSAVQGVPPEEIAKRMAISYAGGQIAQGATGATAGSLGQFGSQAAGQFAGNVGAGILSGKNVDLSNAAINSFINAGMNNYGKDLLGGTGLDKLGEGQPYFNGIASNVLTSALTGKDPNIQNAILNTAMKQAMSGKATQPAKAP